MSHKLAERRRSYCYEIFCLTSILFCAKRGSRASIILLAIKVYSHIYTSDHLFFGEC